MLQRFYEVGLSVVWLGFMAFLIYDSSPWETEPKQWALTLALAVAATVIMAIVYLFGTKLDKFARSKGIGEARFDSETGKLIEDD